jgi:hypothetical protein
VAEARAVAFEIVDADLSMSSNVVLADEISLLLSADDEEFLTKS